MIPRRLNRRTFLKGLGAVSASVPILRSLEAYAQTTVFPKRFIVFHQCHGTVHDMWLPSGGETTFNLSPILQPLQAYRDKLNILSGVNLQVADVNYSCGHTTGMNTVLTGRPLATSGAFGY